jgi:15-cis-phytoene synthase
MISTTNKSCIRAIARHSKSFSLAAALLPPQSAQDAAALYAWCRRADDAIDLIPPAHQEAALSCLRQELAAVYACEAQSDPVLVGFQDVVRRREIPREYPEALLDGMAMDVANVRYQRLEDLLLYCHRVAGTVGLMMCHVLGVSHPVALRHAAHLGMAMQLTNICRDVEEDWHRGRCYLPASMMPVPIPTPIDDASATPPIRQAIRGAVRVLLEQAARMYRSGDGGLRYLRWRAALSIRVARLVYAAIGWRIGLRGYDVWMGRVVVPNAWKLGLVLWALGAALWGLPRAFAHGFRRAAIEKVVRFPGDVLPV